MKRTYSSLNRNVLSGIALALLGLGTLVLGCASEESDPDISVGGTTSNGGQSNGGNSAGGSSGEANGGGGGDGGGSSGGGGGGGASGMCTEITGQIPNNMTGECECPGYIPDLCADAAVCVDLQDNVEHCGMCGNACDPGAACNAGTCTTAPTPAATVTGCMSPRMILSDGVLYVSDSGTGKIWSVPAAGGDPTELATGLMEPGIIATDGTDLYWTNLGDNTIAKMPIAGGTPETLITLDEPAQGIAVGNDLVYFTHVNDVFSIPTTGAPATGGVAPGAITCPEDAPQADKDNPPAPGAAVTGATYVAGSNESCTSGGLPTAIAVDATTILYLISVRSAVESNAVAGGAYVEMGESQGSLLTDVAALTATHGYWATGDHVQRAPLDTGKLDQEQVVQTPDFMPVTAFTLSATHAYAVSSDGLMARSSLATVGESEKIATAQVGAKSLVNDGTNLYWINEDCTINSVAMPQ
jgi:hypothetical protein